jgi:hypothetical protein
MLPVGLVNCGLAAASTLPAAKCCIACSYVFGGWAAGVVVVVVDVVDVVPLLDPDDGVTVTVVVIGVTGSVPPPQALTTSGTTASATAPATARSRRVVVVVEGITAGITGHQGATTTLHGPPREPRSSADARGAYPLVI